MIGQTIGNYVVRDKIGEGGMGVVYVAEHPRIGRKVAIKVLLPEYSQNPEVVARFFTEARASSAIKNEHIIDIIDFGELPDRSSYIIMEWLEGRSLSDVLERDGALPVERALHISRGMGRALASAHANGIVHRDLKPDNIFLVPRGDDRDFVKVLDFGIAKLLGEQGANPQSKTRTGAIIGTPMYMSPEQCRGVAVDERSDIYSFGVIVYQMLAGKLPFVAEGLGDLLLAHMTETPAPVEAPEEVARAVARALEKDPQKRPQRVTDFVAELTGRTTLPVQALPLVAHATPIDTLAAAAGEKTTFAPKRSDARWPLVVAPIALLAIGGAIYATRRDVQKPTPAVSVPPPTVRVTLPTSEPAKVHVSVRATPAEARISVDGVTHVNPYGAEVESDARNHIVEISAPGYETYQTTVRFDHTVELPRDLVPSVSSKVDGKNGHGVKPVQRGSAPKPVATTSAPKSDAPKPDAHPDAPKPDGKAPTLFQGTSGTLQTKDPFTP